jgi:uncharacterized protein
MEEAMMNQLTDEKARALLAESRIGHLGCIYENTPYVVPINYVFEDNSIYSHSLPGRKIDALRANPRACLQVDNIESDFSWQSVITYGRFEEMQTPSDRRTILGKLLARFPSLTPVESVIAGDAAAPDSIVFRIVIDEITGIEESWNRKDER